MLRDKFPVDPLFECILKLTGITIDPELVEIDRILEDDEIFQRVKEDLSRRHPKTLVTGHNSTPAEVVIRLLALEHLYDWSYEDTVRFVSDSLVLRWFCRVYLNLVCSDETLLRWANLIRLETSHLFDERLSTIACELELTRERKLRTDGTVVEANIHHPTDSSLLADGVRVLSRLVERVILPKPGHEPEARRQHERRRWFKRGRRFHAGVEGRISVLERKHGLDRCLYHGGDGFGRWVGWGVIAGNLDVMGTALADPGGTA